MEAQDYPLVDFVVTARKYKTRLTKKYINRPVWNRRQPGEIRSSLPGSVIRITVAEGQQVAEGDVVIMLDAMKMQNRIATPVSGTVSRIYVAEGDRIGKNHLMIKIEPT
jgi:pyruvate carboxylase subunit B